MEIFDSLLLTLFLYHGIFGLHQQKVALPPFEFRFVEAREVPTTLRVLPSPTTPQITSPLPVTLKQVTSPQIQFAAFRPGLPSFEERFVLESPKKTFGTPRPSAAQSDVVLNSDSELDKNTSGKGVTFNVVKPVAPGLPPFESRTVFEVNKDSPTTSPIRVFGVTDSSFVATSNKSTNVTEPTLDENRIGGPGKTNRTQKSPGRGLTRVQGLCGYPPYHDREVCIRQSYYSDPLSGCEKTWGRFIFGICVGLMAFSIILINSLIVIVFVRNPDMRSHYEYIKVSLAVADGIIGFLLFATVIPNMTWIQNLTEEQVTQYTIQSTNSANAIILGSLLIITIEASLLHLVFLSIERFMAIKWTLWHMKRKTRTVIYTLTGIWIVSIITSFIPAALPNYFEYKFAPALLLHMLTVKSNNGTASNVGYEGTIYAVITMVLPYVIMVSFCIFTGIVSFQKIRSTVRIFGKEHASPGHSSTDPVSTITSKEVFSPVHRKQKRRVQPEISVFVTILIMIAAFTFTLLPFTILVVIFSEKILNCTNYQPSYAITFYVGLLNSIANGLIYSARDLKFREAVRKLFCRGKNHSHNRKLVTSNTVSSTSRT